MSVSWPPGSVSASAAILLGGLLSACLPELSEAPPSYPNTPPALSEVTLSPSPIYTNDILTASVTASDEDDDSLSMTYEWYVEGSLVLSGSDTLDGTTAFDKGNIVHVAVGVDDGTDLASTNSAMITVDNAPPTTPEVRIEPSSPRAGDRLTCLVLTESHDPDGDPIQYAMNWTVDGVSYNSGSGWMGPSTTTWSNDTTDALDSGYGQTWQCTAVPSDGEVSGASATASTKTASCDFDGDGHLPPDCGGLDCEDTDPLVNPDAEELCENGIDENCNGDLSEGCPSLYLSCSSPTLFATGHSLSCNFGEPLMVDSIRVSVGCNDNETGAYTVSFDSGEERSFTGYCTSLHEAGIIASSATITMHSGGGGDDLISLDAWGFDYR